MAVVHRVLFTWFYLLVFLALLNMKLEQKIQWNWFIVFIPMWFYDLVLLGNGVFFIISHCKNGRVRDVYREVWYTAAVFLKLSVEILICVKLEVSQWFLPAKVVLAPFWILLSALAVYVFVQLIKLHRF
ncbi:transmembrane protein 60 [Megalopta genalis]|uniref:transmembrane protein 60 n=1 Tax=Megalopta genalis TaxID=115081 RepID=UPI001443194F|nr:transmembrane protein 60 [Megalopta genalis]